MRCAELKKRWVSLFLSVYLLVSCFTGIAYAATGDTVVYRTKTGKCYHTANCSSLKSSIEVTLQEAINKGLRPCSKCNPPTLDAVIIEKQSNNTSSSSASLARMSGLGSGSQFIVTISATCVKNNSVGNEWDTAFSVDGHEIKSGDTITVGSNSVVIKTTITEFDDGKDDIGESSTTYMISDSDLSNGFTVKQTVIVTENGGQYKGHSAEWTAEYKFSSK